MKLWTKQVKLLSDDVLLIAQQALNIHRTFFIAKTDDDWFEVHQIVGDSVKGRNIDSNIRLPIDESYCGILFRTKQEVLQIDDAQADSRVSDMAVTKDAGIGSYLGIRIELSNGETYGTICAINPEPTQFLQSDISALQALARILARALDSEGLAYKDSLSDLYNRRYYNALLRETRETDVIVHLFDVDNFKSINDELGHDQGDQLIHYIGTTLKKVYIGAEVIRLGGDEFCVITNMMSMEQVHERLSEVTNSLHSFECKRITASCGVVSGHFADLSKLMSLADKAMYRAKSEGYPFVVESTEL